MTNNTGLYETWDTPFGKFRIWQSTTSIECMVDGVWTSMPEPAQALARQTIPADLHDVDVVVSRTNDWEAIYWSNTHMSGHDECDQHHVGCLDLPTKQRVVVLRVGSDSDVPGAAYTIYLDEDSATDLAAMLRSEAKSC